MEAPLALYRRYRPDTFAQVIGQDHVTEPLRAALRGNRVNHAYLFSGPRGCGKTTSARILARALNCAKGPTDEPCGVCDSCMELATGGPGSVDVIEIDAASHGGVEDARDLREQATFQPMRDRYKVYIIDEAHMVTAQGFNALLKIVEEPPEHVRFVFATTEPEKVIGTVRSRTHHYPFRLIPPKVLSAYMAELCEREGVAIEPAALPLIVRAGGGSARDTLSVLDQLIGGAGTDGVTHRLTAGLLGFTPDTLLDDVVDAFAAHDAAGVFRVVDAVIETGQNPRRFTEDLLQRLRDLVIISAVPDAPATGLIDVPEDQAERLVAQAARFGRHELSRAADLVAEGLAELKGTTAPRLLLELLCARVLLPGADDTSRGLGARMDRLEKRLSMAPAGGPPAREDAPEPVSASAPRAAEAPPREESTQAPVDSAPAAHQGGRPARASEPTPPASEPTPPGLSLSEVRRLWPEILEAVKGHRRFTWIQLSQHAQVVGLEGQTLTLGFNHPGARESFVNGRGDAILQQVLIDLVGAEWRIESIVDPAARPAAQGSGAPSGPRPDRGEGRTGGWAPTPAPGSTPAPAPEAAPGQAPPAGPSGSPGSAASTADTAASRDDPPADDADLDATGLLTERLGAQVIEEIPHE